MFCKRCGAELKENSRFCAICGEKVIKTEIPETVETEETINQNIEAESDTYADISDKVEYDAKDISMEQSDADNSSGFPDYNFNYSDTTASRKRARKSKKEVRSLEKNPGVKMAMVFITISALFVVFKIIFGLIKDDYSGYFPLFLAIAAVLCIMILNTMFSNMFVRILRGIGILALFEISIISFMGVINNAIDNITSISSIRNVIVVLWLLATLAWLVIAGIKAIFIGDSRCLFTFEIIVFLVSSLFGIISIVSIFDTQLSMSGFAGINTVNLFMDVIIYITFILFMIANIGLSYGDNKSYK